MHTTKTFYIVALLVGGLVLAISVGLIVWHLKPDKPTAEETPEQNLCYPETISSSNNENSLQNFQHGLVIMSNDRNILIHDPHQNLTVSALSLQSGRINDYDVCMNKTLWYSVKDGFNKPVSSISAEYPDLMPPDLRGNAKKWDATAIAVDFRTEKVYVYDNESLSIDIFDMHGKNRGILLTELPDITDIALDPYRAVIFMLSPTEIIKASMDGTYLDGPNGVPFLTRYKAFVIDYKAGALIITDGKNVVNYGVAISSMQKQVIHSSTDIDITSMAILGEYMYFTMKSLVSPTSILVSCYMPRCFNRREYKELLIENPQKVKAFDTFEPVYQENPCEHFNGDCHHFCLLASIHRRRSCACKLGWQLDDDRLSCKPVKEYIIFVRGRFIRSKISSATWGRFSEAVAMKRLPDQVSMKQRRWIHFDYNAHKNYLIFNDDQSLYRLDMINYVGNVILLEGGIPYEVRPSVDWISDNVYFIRPSNYGNDHTFIMVRDSTYTTVFTSQRVVRSFQESMKPRALALHPNRALIFVALYNAIARKGQIYRMYTDGSNLTEYTLEQENASVNETILKVDWATDRLYWLSEDKKEVQHAALDGSDLKVFKIPFAEDPVEINIHRDWLYISERRFTWRVHKRTGEFARIILLSHPKIQERQLTSATAGFGRKLQPIRDDHPCLYKNGGCDRYCFALPLLDSKLKKVCGCNKNEKLVGGNKCIPL